MSAPFQPRYQILTSFLFGLLLFLFGFLGFRTYQNVGTAQSDSTQVYAAPDSNFTHVWTAPSDWRMMYLQPEEKELVVYGKELIAHTSEYLGPQGSVKAISNGMNCQNCHLNAGTQPWEIITSQFNRLTLSSELGLERRKIKLDV